MELSEAKRVLNDWNKAEEWTIKDPDYRHKDVYIERKEAIETVLQALEEYSKQLDLDYVDENYISKDKIKKKIEEIKKAPVIINGGRSQGKTLAHGIKLGKMQAYEELLKGE